MARNGVTQQPRCAVRLVKGPFVRPRPHPGHCEDEAGLARLLKGCRRPTAVDLFCGAGGLSLGLQEAGFDVVMGIDADKEAIETHASLFPGLSATWDLFDQKVPAILIGRQGAHAALGEDGKAPRKRRPTRSLAVVSRGGRAEHAAGGPDGERA